MGPPPKWVVPSPYIKFLCGKLNRSRVIQKVTRDDIIVIRET